MTQDSASENAIDSTATGPSRAAIDGALRAVLVDVLGLDAERVAGFDNDTGLFGHLPELDSMAVATLLTEIEDRLHLTIEDDEVEGEMLESYGALLAFVEAKAVLG
jgi:acyl carrier protein